MPNRRTLLSMAALLAGAAMTGSARASGGSAPEAGYYLPDEADPHERTFMQWPVNPVVHDDPVFLDMLQQTIADIANTIAEFEPVVMLMADRHRMSAQRKLSESVEIWDVPTDDLWCRDSGPLFVVDGAGGLAVSQLNFNGWGDKQPHGSDGRIAARVADILGLTVFDNGIVGEAGGVEADGHGTLIAHESSWVNPNRNAGTREQIGDRLLAALGASKMIWAPGVAGADITDYHIDSLARFVAPGHVLFQLAAGDDPDDPWVHAAQQTLDILRNSTDALGQPLRITTIDEPVTPRLTHADFVASYVNYYVCNGAVIVSQFGDTGADRAAIETLTDLFPDREIVALDTDPVGETGGGIHCATREQPRV